MAYYLQWPASNGWVTTPDWVPPNVDDWSFEIDMQTPSTTSGDKTIAGREDSSGQRSWKLFIKNGELGILHNSNWSVGGILSTPTTPSSRILVRGEFDVDTIRLYVNNNLVASASGRNLNVTSGGSHLSAFGRSIVSNTSIITDLALYRARFWSDASQTVLALDYNPSTSNGTGSILPEDVGGSDGSLVNFPTDDSQWVFYDDGQGGGDTLIPTLIPSGEVVGTPSVTNLLKLIEPNTIPTEEVVNTPTVDAGAILISPATIPTGEVVYNVSIVDLTQFIEAEDIPTQEVVGSPNLELLLSRIFPTAIATQEDFETPLVIGGDRIAIPVNDRATWNRVAAYLRTRKFDGNDNDVILAWLRSEGYIDTFNDAFNTYLEDVEALQGSLTDKYSNWRRQ
jgi:hypothetical protein